MNFWELSPKQVEDLQGGDGGPFRDFVNQLIRAQAAVCGIPSSGIAADSTTARDGGVDCQVSEAAPGDSSGRLREKTCWQFKATTHDNITEPALRREVRKSYCSALIREGYAYRLCITDSLVAEKKTEWEAVLAEEIRTLKPDAPAPQVLTSTCLAQWASHFPPIVAAYVPVERFLHLEAWGKQVVRPTRKYVPVDIWKSMADQIREHVDFSKPAGALVLLVHADAGIGKTRLVYETLAELPSSRGLVIYTDDDDAAYYLAHHLALQPDRFAILVIDECSPEARLKVQLRLPSSEHQVRVITIGNYTRPNSSAEPTLRRMPNESVEQILKENFPLVPEESRRAAVAMAGGFVKIAADFCQHGLAAGLIRVDDYYRFRIPDEDARKVIEAISLVKKVGFSGEVSKQFEDLCVLTGLNAEDAKRRAKLLKDSPGFVAIGGRFFYVTPEAIAHIALQNAWRHWIEDDPEGFFTRVPESLLDEFHTRVAHSGSNEFRAATAQHFTRWSSELTASALADKKKADRLVALVDTDPTRFLPTLVRLVEQATPDELLANTGWGARRSVVWLCERLSTFPEYFYDVERILVRLALHESEEGITNNATGTWKQLFTMLLSGSSLPYCDRLRLLESRLFSKSPAEAGLALEALQGIFASHASRMVGPSVVAGRIPPPNWQPKTHQENNACYEAAFTLYEKIVASGTEALRERALDTLTARTNWFLRHDLLDRIRELLRPPRVSIARLPKVIGEIELFVHWQAREKQKDVVSQEYLDRVIAWRTSLVPNDLHARLVSIVGQQNYRFGEDEEEKQWRMQLRALAAELVADSHLMQQELAWLTSADAKSSAELGEEIARSDKDAKLFEMILSNAASNLALHRGYVFGLAHSHPDLLPQLNSFLDQLERTNAQLAFEYAATVPKETDAFGRWMRLCDAGLIAGSFVRALVYRLGLKEMTVEHVRQSLPRLLKAIAASEPQAGEAALEIAHAWVERRKPDDVGLLKSDNELWTLISRALSEVVPTETMANYYWEQTLNVYCRINPADAAKITGARLVNDEFSVREAAERVLMRIAEQHPTLLMQELGRLLLDEKEGWRLQIGGCRSLILSVPPQVVMAWLDQTQVGGARKIAGSLPRPFLDQGQNAVVPQLTEMVLTRFGNDEKVVRGFMCDAGVRSYSGDIAGQKLAEATTAARFLQHPLPAIREWARIEKLSSEHEAERWRQEDAERHI